MSEEIVRKSFKITGISNNPDGSEDHLTDDQINDDKGDESNLEL